MLEESKEFFNDIKKSSQKDQYKKIKRKAFFVKCKKYFVMLTISLSIICVFGFPKQTGYVIGKWINDFFGTIIKQSIIK